MSSPTSIPEDFTLDSLPPIDAEAVTASSTIPAPLMEPPLNGDALASIPTTLPTTVVSNPAVPPTQPAAAAVPPTTSTMTKKSKKKKQQPVPQVTMATAASASSGSQGAQGENTGRWTAEEHRLFLQGLDQHGKGWKKIASLIKTRTVVQIRTHAQKYFQKLAKARQNGEEGDVPMEGRGIPGAVTTGTTTGGHTTKRRRQTTGTKRKAISSVVASAQRQGKRMATAQATAGVANPTPPLPAVAPALAPFVPPTTFPSITTAHGTISGPALEDSLYVSQVRICPCTALDHQSLAEFLTLCLSSFSCVIQFPFPYACSSGSCNGTNASQRRGSSGRSQSDIGSFRQVAVAA